MDRQRVVTILTVVIVVFWMITAVVRIWQPWPAASIVDSAMPLVIGYWFVINAAAKKNGTPTGKEPVTA
jgi:hypothetical protein